MSDEIDQLEKDLLARQTQELENLKITDIAAADNDKERKDEKTSDENASAEQQLRVSKAQKRREKKEQDAKRREEELLIAEEDNKNSARNLETRAINAKLKTRNLSLHQIKSDGDCLYNAIKHQLEIFGINKSVEELRRMAADFIRADRDELICFMTSPKTNDTMTAEEFEEYCNQVENTKAWGSQIEIKALSCALKVQIEVVQSTGSPTISGIEFKEQPHLIVTYHRHFFGLGEHYNSTKPFVNDEEIADE